jgi:hypothetical protein
LYAPPKERCDKHAATKGDVLSPAVIQKSIDTIIFISIFTFW